MDVFDTRSQGLEVSDGGGFIVGVDITVSINVGNRVVAICTRQGGMTQAATSSCSRALAAAHSS